MIAVHGELCFRGLKRPLLPSFSSRKNRKAHKVAASPPPDYPDDVLTMASSHTAPWPVSLASRRLQEPDRVGPQNFLSPAKPPGPRPEPSDEITPSHELIQAGGPSAERHWLPGRAAALPGVAASPRFTLPVPGFEVPRAAVFEPPPAAAPLPASFPTPLPYTSPAASPNNGGPEDLCPQFPKHPCSVIPRILANNVTLEPAR